MSGRQPVSFRLQADQVGRLRAIAKVSGLTMTDVLQRLIEAAYAVLRREIES